ncbi:XRE family transcriptional regulator [Kribbella albertanoniae]|uniref:XRE family transcriptional regulator n=2 Tax=Kribbella albertanoniae TaxID=1266829 RepID=A0A4R4Q1Q1_9ACTN|nr:XRE family transcriptional regulator [Kribbella albertanoniae]
MATLSYWQSGRSRPERRDSLTAVALLEEVLEVPVGTLSASLGPPRPRGRWLSTVPDRPDVAAYWPRPGAVEAAVREVDIHWDERLTRISQHDRVFIGADRGERSYHSRQVLRAEADGPDRWVVIMHLDEHDRPLPDIWPLRHCSLGRTVRRPEDGLLVAELLFDRPLRKGETVITEHELVNVAPYPPATNYERKFRLPVREFVLELCFDPDVLPATCTAFSQLDDGAEQTRVVDVAPEVHDVVLNFGPGRHGFRWTWV